MIAGCLENGNFCILHSLSISSTLLSTSSKNKNSVFTDIAVLDVSLYSVFDTSFITVNIGVGFQYEEEEEKDLLSIIETLAQLIPIIK